MGRINGYKGRGWNDFRYHKRLINFGWFNTRLSLSLTLSALDNTNNFGLNTTF